MTAPTIDRLLRRTIHLDALSYLLISLLMALVAILTYMVVTSTAPPAGWLLSQTGFQLLGAMLLSALVIYLLDQHRRLRLELCRVSEDLEDARRATDNACAGLLAAHEASRIMVGTSADEAFEFLVGALRADLGADGVVLVNDEIVPSFASTVSEAGAMTLVERAANDAVCRGASLTLADDDGAKVTAVPLRVLGCLRGVLCVYAAAGNSLTSTEIEGLTLITRVIELGWESQILQRNTTSQLEGTLRIIEHLVEQHRPRYAVTTNRLLSLCNAVGREMHLTTTDQSSLLLAVRLRDLGVLESAETSLDDLLGRYVGAKAMSTDDCGDSGARLAEMGNFPAEVQETIRTHTMSHECTCREDTAIPLTARIIHACEAFVALEQESPLAAQWGSTGVLIMARRAPSEYDPDVLQALANSLERLEAERQPESIPLRDVVSVVASLG